MPIIHTGPGRQRIARPLMSGAYGLALFAAACGLPSRLVAQNALIEDNFDSETVGDAPSGWKSGGGGLAVVTNNVFHSKPNSLALVNTKLATAAYALKNVETAIPSNESEPIIVSFRIRLPQKTAAVNAMVTDGSTAFLFRICFNNAGQITASTGKEDMVLDSYKEGVWYGVRIAFVPAKHEYDIEVRDDKQAIASRKGLSAEPRDLYYVYLQNFGMADGNAIAYFDDVTVTKGVAVPK